jgi:hypothetical protein
MPAFGCLGRSSPTPLQASPTQELAQTWCRQFLATEVSRDFIPPCPVRISPAQAAALGPALEKNRYGTLAANSMLTAEQMTCQTDRCIVVDDAFSIDHDANSLQPIAPQSRTDARRSAVFLWSLAEAKSRTETLLESWVSAGCCQSEAGSEGRAVQASLGSGTSGMARKKCGVLALSRLSGQLRSILRNLTRAAVSSKRSTFEVPHSEQPAQIVIAMHCGDHAGHSRSTVARVWFGLAATTRCIMATKLFCSALLRLANVSR